MLECHTFTIEMKATKYLILVEQENELGNSYKACLELRYCGLKCEMEPLDFKSVFSNTSNCISFKISLKHSIYKLAICHQVIVDIRFLFDVSEVETCRSVYDIIWFYLWLKCHNGSDTCNLW